MEESDLKAVDQRDISCTDGELTELTPYISLNFKSTCLQ